MTKTSRQQSMHRLSFLYVTYGKTKSGYNEHEMLFRTIRCLSLAALFWRSQIHSLDRTWALNRILEISDCAQTLTRCLLLVLDIKFKLLHRTWINQYAEYAVSIIQAKKIDMAVTLHKVFVLVLSAEWCSTRECSEIKELGHEEKAWKASKRLALYVAERFFGERNYR